MAGQRRCFGGNALHKTAIATNSVNVVIEDFEVRAVVAARQPLLCDGHSHACGDSLSQRARRRLYARYPVILRMARRLAVELAEMADILKCYCRLSEYLVFGVHGSRLRQVECGPDQHRGVTVRQHKAIAIGPDRILRIETEYAVPDGIDEWGEGHRRTGMSGFRLLNGINRERA